jgi:predicted phage-related endonuclease
MRKHYLLATILALPAIAHDNLEPGSPQWLEHRAKYRNASDAPSVMGADPHRSRNDYLLARHRGFHPDVSNFKQGILDSGHRIEALARPLPEKIIGEELYARVYTRGILGASLDGCTFDGSTNWECKRLNEELRQALPHSGPNTVDLNDAADLPLRFRIQMEQQLLVRGAERCLFTAAHEEGGQITDARHCWYESDPQLRERLLAEWNQLEEDEENYTPPEVIDAKPIVVLRPDQLPAIRTEVKGALVLESNIKEWEEAALAYIKDVTDHELKTDEDFANADAAAKWCDTSKEQLLGVRANLLSATGDVNIAIGTLDRVMKALDDGRIAFEKAIRTRKETRKTEMADEARQKLLAVIAKCDADLATMLPEGTKPLMPEIQHKKIEANFGKCFVNKRSFKNMQDALDQELARATIAATTLRDLFRANYLMLQEEAKGHGTLFPDWRTLIYTDTELLRPLVKQRIADHVAEQQRIQREADEKRQREDAERLAREQATAAAPAPAPAPQERAQTVNVEVLDGPRGEAAPRPIYRGSDVVDVGARYAETRNADMPVGMGHASHIGPVDGARRAVPVRGVPNAEPTLRMGEINQRLGVVITTALLVRLGLPPAFQKGTDVRWHEQDFPFICDALIRHVAAVRNGTPAQQQAA